MPNFLNRAFVLRNVLIACNRQLCVWSRKYTKMEHIQLTADQARLPGMFDATVMSVKHETPSTLRLSLKIGAGVDVNTLKDNCFKAGQWVDFYAPSVPKVGGFSICSTPSLLAQFSIIELVVKRSADEPANWVHTKCKPGDAVKLQVGGGFYYDPLEAKESHNLLLIAGGVGINPIYSMFLTASTAKSNKATFSKLQKCILLYSARTNDELQFKDRIIKVVSDQPDFRYKFFFTRESNLIELERNTCAGRITDVDNHVLQDACTYLLSRHVPIFTYICGPTAMVKDVKSLLLLYGIKNELIFVEDWTRA